MEAINKMRIKYQILSSFNALKDQNNTDFQMLSQTVQGRKANFLLVLERQVLYSLYSF